MPPSPRLKIALLTYSTKPRGSVIHTLELAQALAELGHEPVVFALDKTGEGFHRAVSFKTFAVPAAACEGDTNTLVSQRIGEFVSFFEQHLSQCETSYDIYHAQDCLSANALALLKERGYLSHFLRTVHHIENFKSPYLQACQHKSIVNSDRCLCVSELWQTTLQAEYGILGHRVVNGVSRRFLSREVDELALKEARSLLSKRSSLEATSGEATSGDRTAKTTSAPLYMTVGGIEPRKNSIALLKAFAAVQTTYPHARLMIVGGATLFDYQAYRDQFMAWVDRCDLDDGLILPGVVSDQVLAQLYRLADAFVFPSIKEGWGLVVLESIASGLPVVTSNRAPFTEFLSEESAILVEPTDVDAIADAMLKVIESDTAAQLRAHAPSVLESYSWRRSAEMHLDLYLEIHLRDTA